MTGTEKSARKGIAHKLREDASAANPELWDKLKASFSRPINLLFVL